MSEQQSQAKQNCEWTKQETIITAQSTIAKEQESRREAQSRTDNYHDDAKHDRERTTPQQDDKHI